MNRSLTLALAAMTAAGTVACQASTLRTSAPTPLVDVQVLDRTTGEALPVYWHDGQRWIAGAPGHRYAVLVRSHWDARVLGVVAVDGVNAVSGETAAWDQPGYVLSPYQAFDILGWRKSEQNVADFVFTAIEDSYAARTDRPHDVGVIGIAVFRERAPPQPARLSRLNEPMAKRAEGGSSDAAAAPGPAAAASGIDQSAPRVPAAEAPSRARLGTGHGPSEYSAVSMTDFTRAQEQPDQLITIRYDRRDRLVALGILPGADNPDAFPQSSRQGFVADPPAR